MATDIDTLLSTEPQPAPTGEVASKRRRSLVDLGLGIVLTAFALGLRLWHIGPAYDLFEDEIDYVDLGRSTLHGHFPPVFHSNIASAGSGPFLLHPPMTFVVSAFWQLITQPSGDYFHLVDDVRVMQAVIAAGCVALLFNIGRQLGNRWTGVVAALLFVLDPYVIRQNGRVLLETPTLAFVLIGFTLFLRLYQGRARHPAVVAIAGGVIAGLGIVSKEMTVVMIELPLVVALVLGEGARRRWNIAAIISSLVPYGAFLVALAVSHSFDAYSTSLTSGLRRFFGEQKSTGFSRPGSTSLTHTLWVQLSSFGTTYLVLGVALLAALYLLIVDRHRADRRLLVMLVVGGGLTVFYALFFGTIEEQFLYFLIVPAFLAVAVGITSALERRAVTARRASLAVALVALVGVCGWNASVWWQVRTQPDNGEQRVAAWFQQHAPDPGVIGNDTNVTALALHRMGYQTAIITTPAAAAREGISYLTVLPTETKGNFGEVSPEQEQFYLDTGHVVFSFHEATYGDVQIVETNDPALW